jgi:hypothetical protein
VMIIKFNELEGDLKESMKKQFKKYLEKID